MTVEKMLREWKRMRMASRRRMATVIWERMGAMAAKEARERMEAMAAKEAQEAREAVEVPEEAQAAAETKAAPETVQNTE